MNGRGGDAAAKLRAELTRFSTQNPFQILGIPPFASVDVVRSAYLQAAKRFHPTLFALQSPEARELANEVFLIIRRVYAELIDEEKRKVWRERVAGPGPAPKPEALAPETRAEPGKADPGKAEPPKAEAPRREPPRRPPPARQGPPKQDVKDLLERVRTRPQRIDEAIFHIKKGRFRQARESLFQIAAEDPQNKRVRTQLHLAWGLEHREAGNLDDAARELERALMLDPTCAEADKALRDLGKKKGLLSKIFGPRE